MNEKMRILKMIENGQISAAEAVPLLQAVEAGGAKPAPPPKPAKKDDRSNNGTSGAEPTGLDDLGQKFESFAREYAPKVERFAEAVAAQIAGAAGKVSDVFNSADAPRDESPRPAQSQSPRSAPVPPKPAAPSKPGVALETQIEMPVEIGGYNELNLSGMNGDLRVTGYNGDKITAQLSYRAKTAGAHIELVKLGSKYFLQYEPDEFSMVAIDAFVPERAFGTVRISGTNGKLDVSKLSAKEVNLSNANGLLAVSNIVAENAAIENINAPLEVSEPDISRFKLSNYNSPVSISVSKFAQYADYIWDVETGNAKLNINLPTAPDLGYHIKAHAAMGEIRLGLTGLQYLINEPSLVEARSASFDTVTKKVKIAVETSNAPLTIN